MGDATKERAVRRQRRAPSQGLVNLAVGRRGRVWRERYHRRDLTTPRQVRNALVYVLFNLRKHGLREVLTRARAGPAPVAAPQTFLARRGWQRHGALRVDEMPRVPA